MSNPLVDYARVTRKKNGFIAVVCFFIAAVISAGILMLNIFWSELFILLIPFLVLPIMFAFQRTIVYLRDNETLSFMVVLSSFVSYFTERNRSNYCVLSELWKLIVTYFGTMFISIIIGSMAFYYTNFLGFGDMLNELLSLPYVTIESMDLILTTYESAYNAFFIMYFVPAGFITCLYGLYLFSINSISFFIRISGVRYTGSLIKRIYRRFKYNNFSILNRKFFALNWPLFILFILGFGVGGYLGFLYNASANAIFTFGLVGAILLSFGLYGSFYFANKEAIYFHFVNDIHNSYMNIKRELDDYLRSIYPNPQEREEISQELFEGEEKENDSNES